MYVDLLIVVPLLFGDVYSWKWVKREMFCQVVRVFDPSLMHMRDIAAESMNEPLFIDYSILQSGLYVCIGSDLRWLLFMAAVCMEWVLNPYTLLLIDRYCWIFYGVLHLGLDHWMTSCVHSYLLEV